MKTRKIYGIDKSVCNAEQKIAYNLAFRAHINYGDNYRALPVIEKPAALKTIIERIMRSYRSGYLYKPGYYNEDAIQMYLQNGLHTYLMHAFIATDYEHIGLSFQANKE